MSFEDYFSDPDYIVEDLKLDGDELEYLFVLESPHNDEIRNKYPVAGDSGKDMVAYLFDNEACNQALGEVVQKGEKEWSKKIGIINVSQVPLQEVDEILKDEKYPKDKQLDEMFNILNRIRIAKTGFGNFKGISGAVANKYEMIIHQKFVERLNRVNNKKKINIILCGRFAQKHYIQYVDIESKKPNFIPFKENYDVPHPARHNWKGQFDKLQELKVIINDNREQDK